MSGKKKANVILSYTIEYETIDALNHALIEIKDKSIKVMDYGFKTHDNQKPQIYRIVRDGVLYLDNVDK